MGGWCTGIIRISYLHHTVNCSLLLRHSKDFDLEFKEGGSIVLIILFQSWSTQLFLNSTLELAKSLVGAGHLISLRWFVLVLRVHTQTRQTVPELQ